MKNVDTINCTSKNIFKSKLQNSVSDTSIKKVKKYQKHTNSLCTVLTHPLYKKYVQLQNKGLDVLNHIDTILFWRKITVPRIWKVRYLGRLKHAQMWWVLGLVLWGLGAWREDVVVGCPRSRWGWVPEGDLVVELVAVGSQVVAVVTAVRLVHGWTVEVLHLEE